MIAKPVIALWRLCPADRAGDWAAAARNPEGRFHHDGQPALYASLSPEGPSISMSRYGDDGVARVLVGLSLEGGALFDLATGDTAGLAQPGIDRKTAMARWDLDRAAGRRPATWDLSDRLRATGWDGFYYPSRLRPDLANLVLFRWNAAGAPILRLTDPPALSP